MQVQKLKWFFQLSRPRFWFYLFGPFLLGLAWAPYALLGDYAVALLILGLFFLFPANLLIYGLNDLFDYETDKHNPKKKAYETLIEPKNRRLFLVVLAGVVLPFLLVILFVSENTAMRLSLLGFLFFGVGYSAPPIRAKTKPFLDSFFNILYIFPGLISYALLSGELPTTDIIIAGTLWCMAMHAFSAVPDIASDKKAGLKTVATVLGKKGTILFCYICYMAAATLTIQYLGTFGFIAACVYATMMLLAFRAKTERELFTIYKLFPYVNVTIGFFLFWVIFFS